MCDVKSILRWDGCCTQLLFYSFFYKNQIYKNLDFSYFNVIPVKQYEPFNLEDVYGYINGNYLILYEVNLDYNYENIESYIRYCLNKIIEHGAVGAFCMFDGCFSFPDLLSSIHYERIYGLSTSSGVSVQIDIDMLKSDDWFDEIRKFRKYLADKKLLLI